MSDYIRHRDIRYISNTLRLKLKKMMYRLLKGRSPIIANATKLIATDNDYILLEKYVSFEYFDHRIAKKYYSNSKALISKIIIALCYFNENGNDQAYLKMVDTIHEKLSVEKDSLVYREPAAYEKFAMQKGAISGITQAKLVSLFLRAGMFEKAKACLNGCLLSETQSGPLRDINDEMTWIEEYPSSKMTMVLNGHIFNLIAFIEYLTYTGDCSFDKIFQKCMNATLSNLPNYWKGNDILYSMYNWDFCNTHYLGIITYQMEHLYKISNIQAFKENSDRLKSICNWSIFNKLIGK